MKKINLICLVCVFFIVGITAKGQNPNLIYEETFEGSTYFPLSGSTINLTHGIENCNDRDIAHGTEYDWTLTSILDPVFQGSKSVKFEIRKDQPLVGSSLRIRSEVVIIKGTEDSRFTPDIWYSFAINFPSRGSEPDNRRCAINQFYEDGSQETTIRTELGKCYLEVTPPEGQGSSSMKRYDLYSTAGGTTGNTGFVDHPVNEWHEFVFHFIHSFGSDGLIEVWRDGVKIHTITGRNMHLQYPKWKIGLYESSLASASNQYNKIVYFDNVRVGKKGSTLADMTSNPPGNNAPTANAGSDKTIKLPTNSVTLSGSGSDTDGTIASYAWTKVSGGAATITNASSASTTVTGLVSGTYQFKLTVTDNEGATGSDTVQVVVNPEGNAAPTVNAGSDKNITLPTSSVTLSGSGTDTDGTIASYAWSKVSGGAATITSASSASTTVTGLVAGTYVFRLTVTDNEGATATDDVQVVVYAENVLSKVVSFTLINAGTEQDIMTIADGATINLNTLGVSKLNIRANVSIPTGSVQFVLSGTQNYTSKDSAEPYALMGDDGNGNYYYGTWNPPALGAYSLTATTYTGSSATGTAGTPYTINFTFTNDTPVPNVAPTANAGSDKSITLPTNSVTLSGSGTDTDGTIASYAWTKVSGGTATITSPASASTTVTGLVAGTYVFRLTVTDNNGATGTDDVQIIVNPAPNVAPTANAGSDNSITLPTNSVTLSGSGTDTDGTIFSYAWTKVSGGAATITSPASASTTVTGLVAGTYVFRLTVTDNQGAKGTDDVQVVVNPAPNVAPTANAGNDKSITLPTNSVTLSGSGTDTDGTIASYAWAKVSGGAATITSSSSASTTVTGLVAGNYVFRLTVTDDKGATASDDIQVVVNTEEVLSQVVSFTLINSGTEQDIMTIANGSTIDLKELGVSKLNIRANVSAPTGSVRFVLSGTQDYTSNDSVAPYALMGDDGNGNYYYGTWNPPALGTYSLSATTYTGSSATGTAGTPYSISFTITDGVPNVPPMAHAGGDQTITLPTNSVTLSGSGTDEDGTIVAYAWTKVSGGAATITSPTSASTTVTGLVAGTYVFRLTVTDNQGAKGTDDVQVVVNEEDLLPHVVSFTLINAGTEKDIMTIENGATIDLKAIGVTKLSIRANVSAATGSVKFVLAGTQSRTYTDNAAPHALFGDNGRGNYYYGNWYPPALGPYSLTATTYTGSKATGTAGTPYTINFTITNDNTGGFTVTQTALAVNEKNGSNSFKVVLDKKPKGKVLIDAVSDAPAYATSSPEHLTFTTENWSTPQMVTVTSTSANIADDVTLNIICKPNTGSLDHDFTKTPAKPVAVTVKNLNPTAVNDTADAISNKVGMVIANEAVMIRVLNNDRSPDNNPLIVKSVTAPVGTAGGKAVISADQKTVSYTPDSAGSATFTYIATKGVGGANDDSSAATVTVNVTDGQPIAYGSVVKLEATDAALAIISGQFTRRPKLCGWYYDPVKDSGNLKQMMYSLCGISKPEEINPLGTVDNEWKRTIPLYNRSSFNTAYRKGTGFADYSGQVSSLIIDLTVSTTENGTEYDNVPLGWKLLLKPPMISDVKNLTDGSSLQAGSIVQILGTYFGNKTPKIWLEYTDDKGRIRQARCRLLKYQPFADGKGKANKSYMDVDPASATYGNSELKVQLPTTWPKEWNSSAKYKFVIDNGVGMSSFEVAN